MALIKCPECGGNVSDKAPACIHCGYPLQNIEQVQELYQIVLVKKKYKVDVSKVLQRVMNKTFEETLQILVSPSLVLIDNITKEEAESYKHKFESNGLEVNIEIYDPLHTPQTIVEDVLVCPRCGSSSIAIGQRGYSVFSGFWGSNKTVNRCGKCGYSWQPKK